jgi:hypothetical protein
VEKYSLIDLLQKKINSILFRVILIAYGLMLLSTNENIFSPWIYIISIIIYVLLYTQFIAYSVVRLSNDFLFILIILFGKSPNDIFNFVFLILPIINSINFSGTKKSKLLYVFTIIIFIIVYYSFTNSTIAFSQAIKITFLILFLGIINWYTHLRLKVKMFREELFGVVDRFYLDKEHIRKPHKIYRKFIEVIHQNINENLIQGLYCFTINKNGSGKVNIINGTSFVWNYKFLDEGFVEKIRKHKTLFDETIIIDEVEIKKNLIIYINFDDNEYLFLFSLEKEIPFYYKLIGFFRTIEPPLSKMSQILLSERKLFEIKHEEIEKLSEKSLYVNRANNMMHFIRNRLSPFSNLSKMLDNLSTVPEDKVENFKKLIFDQNTRSKIELRNITDRADDMLEKSKNPFFYKTLKEVSIERTFTILRKSFMVFFPENEIKTEIKSQLKRRTVKLNEEGFEIFLSDWLNNIKIILLSVILLQLIISYIFHFLMTTISLEKILSAF